MSAAQAPTVAHDHVRRVQGTLARLAQLPDLAATAFVTWDCPNPGEESGRKTRRPPGPRPPTDLNTLAALSPDGHLRELALFADTVAAERGARGYTGATWQVVCAAILAAAPSWETNRDMRVWLADIVDAAYTELAQLARVPRRTPVQCPECGDSMSPAGDDVLVCSSGHEIPGPGRMVARWRLHPSMPTIGIVEQFGITRKTMSDWHKKRKIKPDKSKGKNPYYWFPWDVICQMYPGLVERLDTE